MYAMPYHIFKSDIASVITVAFMKFMLFPNLEIATALAATESDSFA